MVKLGLLVTNEGVGHFVVLFYNFVPPAPENFNFLIYQPKH
jgi:hypothetical protein